MEVIPAIDLRGGKCVRLYQGDYAQETVYSDDPLDTAMRWVDMGATRLHIVDLDGARDGSPANLSAVERIASSVNVPLHLGGGIRDLETARVAIGAGVSRIMLGTAAFEDADLISALLNEFGAESVIVTVDAKDGRVALRGWTEGTSAFATDLVADMAALGVLRFLYTDISRDGTLTEPNFDGVSALVNQSDIRLIAAGGITTVAHLERLARIGTEAAIVGRAIYTGDINLREAIDSLRLPPPLMGEGWGGGDNTLHHVNRCRLTQ